MRKIYFLIVFALFLEACTQKESLNEKIDATLETAVSQYTYLGTQLPEGKFQKPMTSKMITWRRVIPIGGAADSIRVRSFT